MKVIVGLGNPGIRYNRTRHNLGFWVIDELSTRWQIPLTKHKFQAKYGAGLVANEKVLLVKPQTFMNRSGETVGNLVSFYQLSLENLLVVYDDLALWPGFLRVKNRGSAGGHNGVANIIKHLNTTEFPRLRLGIGPPPPFLNAADYVLQGLDEEELKILKKVCFTGADAIEMWLEEGLLKTMSSFNRRQNIGI